MVKSDKLLSVERLDDRCDFLFDGKLLSEIKRDVDFRPAFMRLQVQEAGASFVGSVKDGDDEWTTSLICLRELAIDFGIDVASLAPRVVVTVEGGLVSEVTANHTCQVDVFDYDNDAEEEVSESNHCFTVANALG